MVFPISPFGLPTNASGQPKPSKDSFLMISSKGRSYIEKSKVANHKLAEQYKVMIGQLNPDRGGVNNSIQGSRITTSVSILKPDEVTTATYIILGGFDTLIEAENYASYIKTRFVRFLIYLTLSSMHITQSNFQFVPIQEWSKPWDDNSLYKKYQLSTKEIQYIESLIKPMNDEKLFEPDVQIDPSYGAFDLAEHGVKPGDHITYTPTGQELTVLEDNRIAYDGEPYSIAEFTARYMPENSISRSGVCKGPKYFSYKGVSLYKLKNSFLKVSDEKKD